MQRGGATAFILAAGLGTRLRPLTDHTPKPLLPVRGRPILDYVLDHAHAHGHREIVVNAFWLAPQIEQWAAARPGVRVIVEPVIMATYPIPKSAILPLILLIFGLGEPSKWAIVASNNCKYSEDIRSEVQSLINRIICQAPLTQLQTE